MTARAYSIVMRYGADELDEQSTDDRVVETARRIGLELGARVVVVNELDMLTGEARPIAALTP